MIVFTALAAVAALLLTPDDAFAWGAGSHVAQANIVLRSVDLILPDIAALITRYQRDYLYGCISADVFIGKGYKRHPNHCHNWSVGFKLLKSCMTDAHRSFAYGYLTHLACDIVAHNHYVPNQLYMTVAGKKIGHLYWELRADKFVSAEDWAVAKSVIAHHDPQNDTLMRNIDTKKYIPFIAKKHLFIRTAGLGDLKLWRAAIDRLDNNGNSSISRGYITELHRAGANLAIDLLRNLENSVALKFDPIGTDRLVASKEIRRFMKRTGAHTNTRIFELAQEIKKLDYV